MSRYEENEDIKMGKALIKTMKDLALITIGGLIGYYIVFPLILKVLG